MKLRKVIAGLLSVAMVSSLMVMPTAAATLGDTATLAEVLNTEPPAAGETAYVYTESATVENYVVDASDSASNIKDTGSDAAKMTIIPKGGAVRYEFEGLTNVSSSSTSGIILMGPWSGDSAGNTFHILIGYVSGSKIRVQGAGTTWVSSFGDVDLTNFDFTQPFEFIMKDTGSGDTPVEFWLSTDGENYTCLGAYGYSKVPASTDRTASATTYAGVTATISKATVYTGQTKTGVAAFEGTHTLAQVLPNTTPAEGETAYVYKAGTPVNYTISATSADVTDTGATATSITNLPAGGAVHWKVDMSMGSSGTDGINLLCNWGGEATQSANIFLGMIDKQGPIRIQNSSDTLHTFYTDAAIDLSKPFEIIMKDSESHGTVEYWYSADGGETFALLTSQGYSYSSRVPSVIAKAGSSATISATVYTGKTAIGYITKPESEILPKTGNVGDYAYKTLDTIGRTTLAAGETVSFSGGNSLPAGGALHYKFADVNVGTGYNVLSIHEDRPGFFSGGAVTLVIANFANGAKFRIAEGDEYVYLGSAEDTPINGAFEIILKDTNSGSTPIEFWFKADGETKFKKLGSFAVEDNNSRTSTINAGGTSTASITSATMYKYGALTQDDIGGDIETPDYEEYYYDFVAGEDTSAWVNNSVNLWVVDTANSVLKGSNNDGVESEMNKVSRVTEFADDFVLTAKLRWPVEEEVPFQSGIIVRWRNREVHVKLTYQQYQYFDGSGTTLTGDLRGVLGPEWQEIRLETYNSGEGVKFYLGDTLLFNGSVMIYDSLLGENTVSFYTEQNFLGTAQSAMEIDWVRYVPVAYNITIDTPVSGAKFQAGSTIPLSASTTLSSSSIPYVNYKINGVVVATGTAPTYSAELTGLNAGIYSITAEYGSEVSAARTFSVIQQSSGSLTVTSNGGRSYTLSAGAYNGLESASKVEFLVDGVPVGEVSSAPYTFELSYLTPETHKISAHYYSEAGLLLGIAEKDLKPTFTSDDVSENYTNEISYTVSEGIGNGKYNVLTTLEGKTVTSSSSYELGTNTVPVNGAILYKFNGITGTTMQGGNGNVQLQNLWTDASKGYMVVFGLSSDVRIQDSVDNKHIESTTFAPGLDEKFDLSKPFELLIKDNSINNPKTPIQYWLKFGDMEGFALLAEYGYATASSRTPVIKATSNASANIASITIYECPNPIATDEFEDIDDLVRLTDGTDSLEDLAGGILTGTTLRAIINPRVAAGNVLIVAGYTSRGELKEVEVIDVAGGSIHQVETIDVSGWTTVSSIKAFLWDELNTMKPYDNYDVKSLIKTIDTTTGEDVITLTKVLPTQEPASGETAYVFTQTASVENYEVDASTTAFSQTTGDAATMATVPVGGAVHYKFPEGISGAAINGGSGHVNILGSWSNGKGFNLLLGNAGGMIRFQEDETTNAHKWYNPTGFDVANPFEIIIKDNKNENSSTPVQLWVSGDGGETFELVTEFNYAQKRTATVSASVAVSTTISATVYSGVEKTGAVEFTETAIGDILSTPAPGTYELSNGHHQVLLTHFPEKVTYLTADGEKSFDGGTGRFDIITQGAVADVYRNGQLAFSYYLPQTDEISQSYTAGDMKFSDENLSVPVERGTYFSNTDITQGRYSYRLPSLPYAYRTVFVADSTDNARIAVNDSLFRTDVEIANGKIYAWTIKLDASEAEYIELCNAVNADNVYYHIETVGGMSRIYGNGKWLSTFRSIYSAGEPSVLVEVNSGDGLDYVNVTDNQDLYIYNDDFAASAEFDSADYWQATNGMELSYDEAAEMLGLIAAGATNAVAELTAYAGDQSLSADVTVEHEVGGVWMIFQHSHTNKYTKVGYNFETGNYEMIYSFDGALTTIAQQAGSFPVGESVQLDLVVDTYDDQRTITFSVNGSQIFCESDDKGAHRGKIGFMVTNNNVYLGSVSYRGDAKPVLSMTDTVNNGTAESGGHTFDVIEQDGRILTPTQPGNSKYTTDGGKTWAFGPANSAYGQNVLQLYENQSDGTYALGDEVLSFKPESIADTDIYGRELGNVRVYYSSDKGATWKDWGYMLDEAVATTYFMTADGVKQGPSGRLYAGLELPDAPGIFSEDAGTQQVWYSDDGGRNWTGGEIVTYEDVGSVINEIQVIESQDGIVTMYYRTDTGMIRAIKSYDRGATWDTTHIYRTPFISASNCFGIQVDPTDGKTLYAVWGYDNANLSAQNQYPRQRWAMARSADNGESWEFLGTVYECTAGAVNSNMNVMINITTDYIVIGNYCLDAEANVHTYNRVIMVEKDTLKAVKSFEQVHLTSVDMLETYTGTTFEDMSQFVVANDSNGVVFLNGRKVSDAAQDGKILLDCVASYIGATVGINSSGATVLIYAGAEIAIDNVTDIGGRKFVDRNSIAEQFGFAIYTTSDGICYFGNIDQQVESIEKRFLNGIEIAD